jgi:hypothetical protein
VATEKKKNKKLNNFRASVAALQPGPRANKKKKKEMKMHLSFFFFPAM